MNSLKRTVCALALTASISSTALAGNIGLPRTATGNIGLPRAASGNIGLPRANATGNIGLPRSANTSYRFNLEIAFSENVGVFLRLFLDSALF